MTSLLRSFAFSTSLFALLALAGCGDGGGSAVDSGGAVDAGGTADSGGAVDSGTTADSGGSVDSATPVDSGSTVDSGVNACDYVDEIDRSCGTDDDCVVGLHQIDCCGSSVMIGYRVGNETTYATSESACMATYPDCDCPAMLPTTDSGETVTDTGDVLAACVGRGPTSVCLTYITMRPPDGV